MNRDVSGLICSFCGEPGSHERDLACRLGATICVPCLDRLHTSTRGDRTVDSLAAARELSDEELLALLPVVLRVSRQVDDHAHLTAAELRARKVTWQAIGGALGISRQAAWERYAKRGAHATG